MRRPHLSTGAWIFTTAALVLAVAAPVSYAAVTSTVAIGNANGSNATATVTSTHQLLTTTIAPKDVIMGIGIAHDSGCGAVYIPPAGKAVVVTSITYDMYNNAPGGQNLAFLYNANCTIGSWDVVDTDAADQTETRVFPTGLPMPSVGILSSSAGWVEADITGYLIPASQLPAAAPAAKLPARPAHPTR